MEHHVSIMIQPVIGGFIVQYPVKADSDVKYVTEVVTTVGKAMRITKKAVEEFSLVVKTKDEVEAMCEDPAIFEPREVPAHKANANLSRGTFVY